jgi:hypothetical protein
VRFFLRKLAVGLRRPRPRFATFDSSDEWLHAPRLGREAASKRRILPDRKNSLAGRGFPVSPARFRDRENLLPPPATNL